MDQPANPAPDQPVDPWLAVPTVMSPQIPPVQFTSARLPQPPKPATPILAAERIIPIDVLRGVALLGILVMNIPWFAWAPSAFFNPTKAGGFEGADYAVWFGSHLIFDMKMMTLFSMLFGAGMLVFSDRAIAAGRSAAGLYYRRLLWLLLFGLLHAYLLWSGDILYTYALCGALLYPLRRVYPWILATIGIVLLVIGMGIATAQGIFFDIAREAAQQADVAIARGETPTDFQQDMLEAWPEIQKGFEPDEETAAKEHAAYLGSYWDLFKFRVWENIFMQTGLFLAMMVWRGTGVMLLGMALMKWGVLSGRRSLRFYGTLLAIGYGIGFPMVYFGGKQLEAHDFDFVYMFRQDCHFNYVGSIFVALGHIGLLMLICKTGVLRAITNALAAVGRMALTNYLTHSLVLSIIFFGWGFGLWGSMRRVETLWVIGGIWAFQLIMSPIWLKTFRFGPAEWLWRSLTYWKPQPMLRRDADGPVVVL